MSPTLGSATLATWKQRDKTKEDSTLQWGQPKFSVNSQLQVMTPSVNISARLDRYYSNTETIQTMSGWTESHAENQILTIYLGAHSI
jgi:hypothetical protein